MDKMCAKCIVRLRHNRKGSLLILGYFVLLIILGAGIVMFLLSSHEKLISQRQKFSTMAFDVAEAGLERGLYDLRMDVTNAVGTPDWADGDINGHSVGPDTSQYVSFPYASTALNGGAYSVFMKNVVASSEDVWLQSSGTVGGVTQTLEAYVKMVDLSPWDYAIFAGAGASGQMVNGNVDIRGSVLILGDSLSPGDYAIDIGGTAELVGNNYNGVDPLLQAKALPLPTVVYNGENVETLNSVLRVKKGIVGVSGSATVGEPDVSGNSVKETVDGVYTNEGFGGNQGAGSVYSDNGSSNLYDLGNALSFPSLSDPYPGYASYQDYLYNNSLILTNELSNVQPNSSFSYSDPNGSISMDGAGNLTVSGIVYVDGSNDVSFLKQGANKTITYTGSGSLLVTGNVNVNVSLVTDGNNSFPNNIMGIMTPNDITFDEAQIDVMGVFYAENQVVAMKQTDIMGTIVSNFFDMGTNVPAIYQVPEVKNHLPPGIIGGNTKWYAVVSWEQQ